MRSQKHIKDSERTYVKLVNQRGSFAQRIAGSGCGRFGVCDVITHEKGQTYAVEIKSTKEEVLRLSTKEMERLEELKSVVKQQENLQTKLVIHYKRRGWREHNITNTPISRSYRLTQETTDEVKNKMEKNEIRAKGIVVERDGEYYLEIDDATVKEHNLVDGEDYEVTILGRAQ